METPEGWSKTSWHKYTALQQPKWPDSEHYDEIIKTLSLLPPLVFAGEARNLTADLAAVANGEAFLLQAGDCAESFGPG